MSTCRSCPARCASSSPRRGARPPAGGGGGGGGGDVDVQELPRPLRLLKPEAGAAARGGIGIEEQPQGDQTVAGLGAADGLYGEGLAAETGERSRREEGSEEISPGGHFCR